MSPRHRSPRPGPRPQIFNRSRLDFASGSSRAQEHGRKKSAAPQYAENHGKHHVRCRPRITYVLAPVEIPPSVSFPEPRLESEQEGGHCKHDQEKDETGAAFAPAQRRQCSFSRTKSDRGRSGAQHLARLARYTVRGRPASETRRATQRDVIAWTRLSRQTAIRKTALTNALLWKKARLTPARSSFSVLCSKKSAAAISGIDQ